MREHCPRQQEHVMARRTEEDCATTVALDRKARRSGIRLRCEKAEASVCVSP